MSRSKHTEAQMIAAVKQMEAGRKAEDVAREIGVSAHTIFLAVRLRTSSDSSASSVRNLNRRLRFLTRNKPPRTTQTIIASPSPTPPAVNSPFSISTDVLVDIKKRQRPDLQAVSFATEFWVEK
jgi:hypothetical protein